MDKRKTESTSNVFLDMVAEERDKKARRKKVHDRKVRAEQALRDRREQKHRDKVAKFHESQKRAAETVQENK